MRLYENPNVIYIPGDTDTFVEYDSEGTIPFSYYNGKLYTGELGEIHRSIDAPDGYYGDDRGIYSGRLFCEEKVITFWHFPENKTVLNKVLNDLQNTINQKRHMYASYIPINFKKDNWQIEIPEEGFEELKIYPKGSINNIGARKAGIDWPEWGSWNHEKISRYISIDQYDGNYQRSVEELAQEHVKSPLLKGSKVVPKGFGSKHPAAQKKFKEKMDAPFESKETSKNRKLFENPNLITYNGNSIEYDDIGVFPFSYYNGKLYVGYERTTHDDIPLPKDYKGDTRGIYSGRIFFNQKIITFWHFPEDKAKLKKIISDLKINFGDFDITDWKVEVPSTIELLKQYPNVDENPDNYPQWHDRYNSIDFVPVNDYEKGVERSAEELAQEHIKSPLLKASKVVPTGFGSKHPKAEQKFKEKMNAPFESFYPRLNESPDSVAKPTGANYSPDYITWYHEQAKPFGYYNNIFYLGKNHDIHDDIRVCVNGYYSKDHMRQEFTYPGRIFLDSKLISFWTYPSKELFKKFANDLKEAGIDIMNDPDYLIEINNAPPKEMTHSERFYRTRWDGAWEGAKRPGTKPNLSWVSPKDYVGSEDQSEEEMNQEHILSPLLKKQKNVPKGFGSKHPKAEQKFKEKMNAPFESFYPRINESPDSAHINKPDDEDWYYSAEYTSSYAFPFGYGERPEKGKMRIGKASSSHDESGITRLTGYAGRIWLVPATSYSKAIKLISFWIYPPRTKIKKVVNDIEKVLSKKLNRKIIIWDDPEFKIEILRDLEPTEFYDSKYAQEPKTGKTWVGKEPDPYGDWKDRSKIWDVIPLKNYTGSAQPSKEDIEKEHEISPLLKKKKEVPFGFGSKHPKAEQKFKEKMNAPFESFYPKLNENPEVIVKTDGRKITWHENESYPFGILDDKLHVGKIHGVHYEITPGVYRQMFKHAGRIWPTEKVISFWTYPKDKREFVNIVKKLEDEFKIKMMSDPEWVVEIVKTPTWFGSDWEDVYDDGNNSLLVPMTEYTGSPERSEEELNKAHELSPLLKKQKNVPIGYGSKHPKAEQKFKEKMVAPFESKEENLYPRLFEAGWKRNFAITKSANILTPELLTQELKGLMSNDEFLEWAGVIAVNNANYKPSQEELVNGYCELIVGYIFLKYPSAKEHGFTYQHIYFIDGMREFHPHTYIISNQDKYYDGYNVDGVDHVWNLKYLEKYVTDEAKSGKYDNDNGVNYSNIFTERMRIQHIGERYDGYKLPSVIKRSIKIHVW